MGLIAHNACLVYRNGNIKTGDCIKISQCWFTEFFGDKLRYNHSEYGMQFLGWM